MWQLKFNHGSKPPIKMGREVEPNQFLPIFVPNQEWKPILHSTSDAAPDQQMSSTLQTFLANPYMNSTPYLTTPSGSNNNEVIQDLENLVPIQSTSSGFYDKDKPSTSSEFDKFVDNQATVLLTLEEKKTTLPNLILEGDFVVSIFKSLLIHTYNNIHRCP